MMKGIWKKGIGLSAAFSLVLLIFAVLIPSATAVELSSGVPTLTEVFSGDIIEFNNVSITIRAAEAIPVNFLVFRIFNSTTHREVGRVQFSLQGTEVYDIPVGMFTVKNVTDTTTLPYQHKGDYYGYDERVGDNITGFKHGFGYGYSYESTDLVILYKISYTTCKSGTYYAKLFVKSPKHTYTSANTILFKVTPTIISKITGSNHIKPGCWPNMHSIWNSDVCVDTASKNKKK